MNKAATGTNFDISQSYWTYWHWYGQITGSPSSDEVSTGGWWSTANNIVTNYGIMQEAAFVPEDGGNGVELLLQQVPERKAGKNRVHLDLRVPDLEAEVDRVIALGARSVSEQPVEEFGWIWRVLVDPDGNEFCLRV